MDSLLANYASDDDDEQQQSHQDAAEPTSFASKSLSLPYPSKPSSLFNSLPKPKFLPSHSSLCGSNDGGRQIDDQEALLPTSAPIFSSLPNPKSDQPSPSVTKGLLFSSLPKPSSSTAAAAAAPKKVVKFTPPMLINPATLDDDEDDKEEKKKPSEDFSTGGITASSLSSMLPRPRNTVLGSATAASRISFTETTQASVGENASYENIPHDTDNNTNTSYRNCTTGTETYASYSESYGSYDTYSEYESYSGYGSYAQGYEDHAPSHNNGNDNYGNNGGSESTWGDNVGDGHLVVLEQPPHVPEIARKRGRNQMIPTEIVEVKQDELMKNRPRQDQSKLTGLAFGPSYQPGPSAKEKPSKLLRRKHQIGTLYYDMKQKEMELAERRSRGLLTKAETHAKYGW